MRWSRQNVNPMLVLRNAVCNRQWKETWETAVAHRQALRTHQRQAQNQQRLERACWFLVVWGVRVYRLAHPPVAAATSPTAEVLAKNPTRRSLSGYSWHKPFLRRPPSTFVATAEVCVKKDTVGEVFKRQEQQSEKYGFYTEELPPANPISVPH